MEVDPERGKRIAELREAAGLTQKHLADQLGINVRAMQKWEYGGRINYPNLLAASRILGVTPDHILTGQAGQGDGEFEGDDPIEDRVRRIEASLLSLVHGEVGTIRARLNGLADDFTAFTAWSRAAFTEVTTGLAELRGASDGQTNVVQELSDQVRALRSELREVRGIVESPAATAERERQRNKRRGEGGQAEGL